MHAGQFRHITGGLKFTRGRQTGQLLGPIGRNNPRLADRRHQETHVVPAVACLVALKQQLQHAFVLGTLEVKLLQQVDGRARLALAHQQTRPGQRCREMTLAELPIGQRQVLVPALRRRTPLGRACRREVTRRAGTGPLHRPGKRALGPRPVAFRQRQQSAIEIAPVTGCPKPANGTSGRTQQGNHQRNKQPCTNHGARQHNERHLHPPPADLDQNIPRVLDQTGPQPCSGDNGTDRNERGHYKQQTPFHRRSPSSLDISARLSASSGGSTRSILEASASSRLSASDTFVASISKTRRTASAASPIKPRATSGRERAIANAAVCKVLRTRSRAISISSGPRNSRSTLSTLTRLPTT